MNTTTKPDGAGAALLGQTKAIRASLKGTAKTKLTIFAPDPKDGGGAQTANFVITITGETIDAAFKHAEELRTVLGCNCVSTGDTEITCTCPD